MTAGTSWSDDEIRLLRRLAGEGLTAREIAERFPERTRNAVIGCCHRMLIQLQHKPIIVKEKIKSEEAMIRLLRRPRPRRRTEKPAEPEPVKRGPVRLIDLKDHHCRWPIDGGRGLDALSCGERKVESESYCPEHCRIAYPAWRGYVDDGDETKQAAE